MVKEERRKAKEEREDEEESRLEKKKMGKKESKKGKDNNVDVDSRFNALFTDSAYSIDTTSNLNKVIY